MDGSGEIPRFVRDSDRVKVHDAVDRLAPALAGYVVPNRPEIVPEVLPAGRLDAGEDPHRWTRVPSQSHHDDPGGTAAWLGLVGTARRDGETLTDPDRAPGPPTTEYRCHLGGILTDPAPGKNQFDRCFTVPEPG
jgi:hypothetical protein